LKVAYAKIVQYRERLKRPDLQLSSDEEYRLKLSLLGGEDRALKKKLLMMLENGYKDFDVNKALLIKFNLNIAEAVIWADKDRETIEQILRL
jgi:hypothetical protein